MDAPVGSYGEEDDSSLWIEWKKEVNEDEAMKAALHVLTNIFVLFCVIYIYIVYIYLLLFCVFSTALVVVEEEI